MRLDAAALDAAPFAPARCAALYAAIEVNDRIDEAAPLPRALPPAPGTDRLVDGFRLSRQLWRTGTERASLVALADALRRTGDLGDDDRRVFKHARARFKHLRFAFVLYRADHRCPPAFKALTTTMGHLQDAFRHGHRGRAVRHATLLRLSLTAPAFAWTMREADRLLPANEAGFGRFVSGEIDRLRGILADQVITGHRFHAARKIVSRQVSFHDDMRIVLSGDDAKAHAAMARHLATINGLMGRFHDDLVLRRAQRRIDYARDAFALPGDIRDRLDALVALYGPGTNSSMPSAT